MAICTVAYELLSGNHLLLDFVDLSKDEHHFCHLEEKKQNKIK